MPLAVPIVAAGIVIVILMVGALYARYYVKVPPDQVAIFTGSGGFRVVRGGASIKRPVVERVDFMSLAPFESKLEIHEAYSSEGVPVNVQAVTLVRFNSEEASIKTAAERFLNIRPEELQQTIQNVLLGHIRSVLSTMTVGEINGNRQTLIQQVTQEAEPDFNKLGLSLEVFTIQHINDDHGYLNNMGRTRIAEIQRDAEIGEAKAQRDAKVQSSEARREGETAAAEAEAQIAEAQRDRDVRIANASAETEKARATSAQAGPLAEAEARKGVVQAEVAVEAARVEAQIAVEQQEIAKAEKHLEATVIKPAEAEKTANVTRAEGEQAATVARATGAAEARRLEGRGEADSRTSVAAARQAELEADGRGNAAARTANADALQRELEAEGAGIKAKLVGEAEGKDQLADALKKYAGAGMQLTLGQELIARLPDIVREVAAPMGQIDSVVMIDGGNGGENNPMNRWGAQAPALLGTSLTVLKAFGLDLPALLGANGKHTDGYHTQEPVATTPELEAVASRVGAEDAGSSEEDH